MDPFSLLFSCQDLRISPFLPIFSQDNFSRDRTGIFKSATNHEQIGCAYSERDKYITGGSLSLSMRIVRAGRVFYRENVYLACAKARGTGRTGSIGRPLSGIGNKCRPDIEIWPIISRGGEGLGMGFFAMGK